MSGMTTLLPAFLKALTTKSAPRSSAALRADLASIDMKALEAENSQET